MNNKLKLLTIFFISLLVACTNQQESNIISVNNDFNERETNIIRTLIQDGIIINLKTTENIDFDFEIGFVHYNNGKKIKEVNVLKFIKDNENKDVALNSYISINRIKNKLVTSINDDGIVSVENFFIKKNKSDWQTSSLHKEIDSKDINEIVIASYYIDSKQGRTIVFEKDLQNSKEAIGIVFKKI